MKVQHFFDEDTSTLSYVVHDPETRAAAVIDPVRDYDPKSGRTASTSCEAVARHLDRERLELRYAIDTHAHADHLSGMPFFRERHGAQTVIGAHITRVQAIFRDVFHLGPDFPVDGSQFDRLVSEGDVLPLGSLELRPFHTPGHTPACMTWQVDDALFVGDTLFMPDYGTARCDFPGGSAGDLYDSIQRIYALPDATRIFTAHDYRPGGRPLRFASSVGEQRRENVQLDARTTRERYVAFRSERDAGLDLPTLILPSIQVNVRAGLLPEPESNGVRYLKIPIDRL